LIKSFPLINNFQNDNEERLALIINATGAGTWDWQLLTGDLTFNKGWAKTIGYSVAELQSMTFDTWTDTLHPSDLVNLKNLLEKHWCGELQLYEVEFRIRHKRGHYIWVLAFGKVVNWQENGRPKRMLGTHLDITERKERENERIITSQRLQESQEIAKVGGWELNLETGFLFFSAETYRIHETTPEEFTPCVGAGIDYFLPHSRVKISKALDHAIKKGIGFDLELESLTTKGRRLDVRTTCNVTYKNGIAVRLTGIFQDISEQKAIQRLFETSNLDLEEANKALQLSAYYDPLTELPNRILLSNQIQQAMTASLENDELVAIAFIDLDGFNVLNNRYGDSVGDQFLREISNQLKIALKDSDTLARIGGDEFVAVIDKLNEVEDSYATLSRLLDSASTELDINGHKIKVTASIGVTFYPQSNSSPDQLLRQADQAMYKAKQLGKDRWHIFDIERDYAVKHKHEEIERLRLALKNEELVLFYQPKIDLRTKEIIGLEALIRWDHPEKGILPPIAFLPILELDILSIELGEWVIQSALKQLDNWRSTAMEMPISVNISPMQLQSHNFVSRLEKILEDFPLLNRKSLEFEILESSAFQDINIVSAAIKKCNRLGIAFSIDDFGAGYSSLTYLKRLPAEYLKIDQSFVRGMLVDTDDRTIIKGIIELAKAFNLKVIAEGVETPLHGEELLSLGCFLAQGYGIAKPMPAGDFPAWLECWKEDSRLIDGSI
jgi:diguanylate cyclase (GGDEF)-like protein/PAS domain S-box-containing protein